MKTLSDLPTLVYSVGEVGIMIKQSNKTIYRLVERGILKTLPHGRHKRITAKSLNAFVAAADGGAE